MEFTHKLVALVNKELESGVALNALAHMSIGLGAQVGAEKLRLDTYKDLEGHQYPNISQMPFIILRATSNEIKKTVLGAREKAIEHTVFLNTMTGGTYQEQLENTSKTSEAELVFYGCVLFGPWDEVSQLTKRYSLWK